MNMMMMAWEINNRPLCESHFWQRKPEIRKIVSPRGAVLEKKKGTRMIGLWLEDNIVC